MAKDCKEFAQPAREIFGEISGYFPNKVSDDTPQCAKDGRVCHDEQWYDLRLSNDRKLIIQIWQTIVGQLFQRQASMYWKEYDNLDGFLRVDFSKIKKTEQMAIIQGLNLLVLLENLNDLIENGDFVKS